MEQKTEDALESTTVIRSIPDNQTQLIRLFDKLGVVRCLRRCDTNDLESEDILKPYGKIFSITGKEISGTEGLRIITSRMREFETKVGMMNMFEEHLSAELHNNDLRHYKSKLLMVNLMDVLYQKDQHGIIKDYDALQEIEELSKRLCDLNHKIVIADNEWFLTHIDLRQKITKLSNDSQHSL